MAKEKKVKEEDEGTRASTKTGMVILACTCIHQFQDSQFGAGKRAHNRTAAGKARCTVCSNVKG